MNKHLSSAPRFSPCALLNESSTATGRCIKGRGLATLCGIALALGAAVAFTGPVHAQPNLLFNGDFELDTPTNFYYDNLTGPGHNTGTAFDVPGWEAFAVGDSSSWVKVAVATNGNSDLNLNGINYSIPSPYLGLAGMKTAVSNRVAVTPGTGYYATVTSDNYYAPAGISYFIDWFDAGGTNISSSGGALGDPNGPLTFAPFMQQLAIGGIAPDNATRAGVRFESVDGAPDYPGGATADNFQLIVAQPQPNLLFNGDFELDTPTNFYYDNLTGPGHNTGTAFDVPGWEAFAVGDSSSWVKVAVATNGNSDLNLNGINYSIPSPYLGLAGMKTAVSNRVAVTPGTGYYATVTSDNYYAPAGISYFIDWFDAGGTNISSSGGALGDPNGPLTFAPFMQRLAIGGIAPDNATRAGVRFESVDGAPDYPGGATADNFQLVVQQPVLTITRRDSSVIVSWSNGPGFILQQTSALSASPVWTNLGIQNPQTNAITSSNAFFRVISP